jgi:SNF family Na+-dependent transporter
VGWNTVLIAMGQAFFSLSLGMGALMVYGSYLSSDISIPQTCVIVALLDTLVALLAGLAIFPIVISSGLEMSQGPGIIFQTLTVAFGAMPGGQLFGTLFFILLIFAAWTSSISLIEPMIIWLIEKYDLTRMQAAAFSAGLAWLLGIGTIISFNIGSDFTIYGMTIFELLDYITSNILLPMGGIMITIFVGWFISKENINCRVLSMHTIKPLDLLSLENAVNETSGIITIEENNILGGLGGAVAEACLESGNVPKFFTRIGLNDSYSSVVGDQKYLRNYYGISSQAIESAVRKNIS